MSVAGKPAQSEFRACSTFCGLVPSAPRLAAGGRCVPPQPELCGWSLKPPVRFEDERTPNQRGRAWARPSAPERVDVSDAEWRTRLTPQQFAVLRQKGTERPFTGEFEHPVFAGTFVCAGCGQSLFAAADQFDSGSGWPCFVRPIDPAAVVLETDRSLGMRPRRGLLQPLRRAPRTRVRRRPSADRRALVHQFGEPRARPAESVTFSPKIVTRLQTTCPRVAMSRRP